MHTLPAEAAPTVKSGLQLRISPERGFPQGFLYPQFYVLPT